MRRHAWAVVGPLLLAAAFMVVTIQPVGASSVEPPHWPSVRAPRALNSAPTGVPTAPRTNAPVVCNATFSTVSTPNGPLNNDLFAAASSGPDDVWSVGVYNVAANANTDRPLALHWNGSAWSVVGAVVPATAFWVDLNGVAELSPKDVWIVGTYRVDASTIHGFAEHWNGSAFTLFPMVNPTSASFILAVGTAGGTVWAAGLYFDSFGDSFTLIEKWNGSAWVQIASPNAGGNLDNRLFSISGTGSSDVWAGGLTALNRNAQTSALVEHFDGVSWSVITVPSLAGGSEVAFTKPLEPNHAVGVGSGANFGGGAQVGEVWDLLASGVSTTSTMNGPNIGDNVLEGVDVSGSQVEAVGFSSPGFGFVAGAVTLAFPGTFTPGQPVAWGAAQSTSGLTPSDLLNAFLAVVGTSPFNFWAVGFDTSIVSGLDQTHAEDYCAFHFNVSAPASTTAGTPFSVTVTAEDSNGATDTGYRGTVHFASTDGGATLPANYTFLPGDSGTHTFTGVTLVTPCAPQSITVSDGVAPLTMPATASFQPFFIGACPSAAGTPGSRPTNQSGAGTSTSRAPNPSSPGSPGIRTPRDRISSVQASGVGTQQPASGASRAAASTPSYPAAESDRVFVTSETGQAVQRSGADSAQPATANQSMVGSRTANPAGGGGVPWIQFMVLLAPALIALGAVRRSRRGRWNGKARP